VAKQGELSFGRGNAKLGKEVITFSLPSGYTCPGALDCLSRANRKTGIITDGPATKFRCFSAMSEALFSNVRKSRWDNFELLNDTIDKTSLILDSLLRKKKYFSHVRIHVAGDFYSQDYFNSWLEVAKYMPQVTFYAYTKNLPLWVNAIDIVGNGRKPAKLSNFVLTASRGSKWDNLIAQYKLRTAKVVFSEAQAKSEELSIDHDDSHAMKYGNNFALLLHGIQPAHSKANDALQVLKKSGTMGYRRGALGYGKHFGDKKRIALPVVGATNE
jgi:hypothetical protein